MALLESQALLRIIPRTTYDMRELKAGRVCIPVAQHIDVLGYSRATLQIRVYRGSLPAAASVTVDVADDGTDPTEPGAALMQTTKTAAGEAIGSVTLTEATAFPFYQSVSVDVAATIGRLMAILLSFEGGGDGGPTVEIGLDLVLTGGSVGATVSQPSTYLGYAHEPVERIPTFEELDIREEDPVHLPSAGDADFLARVNEAVRSVLNSGEVQTMAKLPGYPRFGNVNVAIAKPVETVDAPDLVDLVRALILRGNLNLDTPDGGYARFGNVNVGVVAQPPVEGFDEGTQFSGPASE